MQQFDLIIIGGGCAGLSLTNQLIDQGFQGQALILDSRSRYEDDRSWCFWDKQPSTYQHLISQSWQNWRFSSAAKPIQTQACKGYAYHYVRAADFYGYAMTQLDTTNQISLKLNTPVLSISPDGDGWRITTPQQDYLASQVVDTRPPCKETLMQASLFQCFVGLEVANIDPLIAQDSLDLMTEMRVAEQAFCFNYILPISAERTLVEVTFFSNKPIKSAVIAKYLDTLLAQKGWQQANIIRQEMGVLPMGLPQFKDANPMSPSAKNYVNAGIGGGALRASSGYGFLRIQRWAKQAADAMIKRNSLVGQPATPPVLAFMDRIFLQVIKQNPELGPIIFERLLARVAPIRFLRFMDDQPSIIDLVSIIISLPKTPFLKGLICLVLRR
jgi:lycopene beta-cyclase